MARELIAEPAPAGVRVLELRTDRKADVRTLQQLLASYATD